MARKKIREYNSKKLLKAHLARLLGLDLSVQVAQVTQSTDFTELVEQNRWLSHSKLVVKPDMLFGKRGKHDLVGLNLSIAEVEDFIRARMGKRVEIDGCAGAVNTFIVEPFVPHEQEFYLSITSHRMDNKVSFSEHGGIDIEENWDKVHHLSLFTQDAVNSNSLAPLTATLPIELRKKMENFIAACYQVFQDLDFTLMEMNPFTVDPEGMPFPLDMRGELDDTAAFKSGKKWGDLEFPLPFGRTMTSAEEHVHTLDSNTDSESNYQFICPRQVIMIMIKVHSSIGQVGAIPVQGASLKLSILNPKGRIWTMVAGGGASVIYADTVADLGYADELGNYAEYSGAPNQQETYLYAKTLLGCATSNCDGRGRALLVGGGIANFTDVAATFKGIIRAMKEAAESIKAANLRIYVRRGGPNYEAGLDLMRTLGADTGLHVEVFGPATSMTGICELAIDWVNRSGK